MNNNELGIRWIKHFLNGKSLASSYTSSTSWSKTGLNGLTSVQLQTSDNKTYTLSAPKGYTGIFREKDFYNVTFRGFDIPTPGKLYKRQISMKIPSSRDEWVTLDIDIGGNCIVKVIKRENW